MDDRQLMASIAGGDEAALQALLRRFTPLFLYILRPILPDERDREECLADISLRIWQGAGSFDGAKGSLNGWLTALTRNAALNRARAKGTEDAPLEDTVPHGDGSAEDEVLRRERQAKLRAAIAGLPVYERELFYRKYYYCQSTAQMAAELLVKYGNGEPSEHPTDYNTVCNRRPILFQASEVALVAGLDTDVNTISDILTDIGCTVAGGGNGEFSVTPPSWRPDINEPCDLVEEVARLVGYDEIPVTVPPAPVEGKVGLTAEQLRKRQVADELAEYGMVETLSYPFVGDEDYKNFALDADATKKVSVEIANPLAGDRPFLRRDIIPTLAQTVQRNLRRGVENVSLYEIGHVYLWDPNAPAIPALPGAVKPTDEQLAALDAGLPDQPMHVAGILTGNAVDSGWMGDRRAVDWSDAVEAVQRISDRIGAKLTLDQPKAEDVPAQWHPGRAARVMADDTFVGMVGELHPHVTEALGFPAHSAAFELNLTALFATLSGKPVQAKPISTFPPVKQDLAFTVSTDVTAAELEKTIVEAAGNSLESIDLFDVYTGDQLGEGLKSLAYAVTFRAEHKTLTSEDSEAIRKRIVDAAAKLGAQLRA